MGEKRQQQQQQYEINWKNEETNRASRKQIDNVDGIMVEAPHQVCIEDISSKWERDKNIESRL